MLTTLYSANSLEEMDICLRQAAEQHGCSIIGEYDLSSKLRDRGLSTGRKIRVYELCDPIAYSKLLERNPAMGAVLPLRISVHAMEGGVQLSAVSLASLGRSVEDPDMVPLIQEMEMAIREIMTAASRQHHGRAAAGPRKTDTYVHEGAMEGQVSQRGQIPQRIDRLGTKVEDLAGTGGHDAPGG
ncbi:MAG: DUF302 domain-containing protein [Acidobacteria bacterium]|nr:DUF302 domain-containing protein [Acidobacteriota bacterium]